MVVVDEAKVEDKVVVVVGEAASEDETPLRLHPQTEIIELPPKTRSPARVTCCDSLLITKEVISRLITINKSTRVSEWSPPWNRYETMYETIASITANHTFEVNP